MTTLLTVLAYVFALTLVLALVHAARSVRLQNRFRRLGSVEGRTMEEIVRHVGPPNHHVKLANDREILEWRRVRFHVALSFTKGVCDGAMDVNAP